jgi:hypothetical protein
MTPTFPEFVTDVILTTYLPLKNYFNLWIPSQLLLNHEKKCISV